MLVDFEIALVWRAWILASVGAASLFRQYVVPTDHPLPNQKRV
jgi:hypothetical protein